MKTTRKVQSKTPAAKASRGGVNAAYNLARARFAAVGVDTEAALEQLGRVALSLHCWQGDDVGGFEKTGAGMADGGIQATGNHPGKARTADELRADLDKAFSLIPGTHRLNLHACYADYDGKRADRDQLEPRHFARWIDWVKSKRMGLDFNPTFFAHPLAAGGLTLTHPDPEVRRFWVAHGRACRRIGAAMGRALGTPCVTNVWIPDGCKDNPVDRLGPRLRLKESLDDIFSEPIKPSQNLDAVESKLFGIGSECYVAGSHEFYMGYAMANNKLLCLDAGHFHPTESIADKLSAVLLWVDEVLLHVSRGERWDSDHVVTLSDNLRTLAQELVRGGFLGRVHIGLDYFDASINRVAAWVIGARNMHKALLIAMTEPLALLRQCEAEGDTTGRLALTEEARSLPWGAVWDRYCEMQGVPPGEAWLEDVRRYERTVQSKRG